MINVLFSCFVITYFLTLVGSIFNISKKTINKCIFEEIIYGLIIISLVALTINFFLPLSPNLNTLIFFLIILGAFLKKHLFKNKREVLIIFIISFLSSLFLLFSDSYRPDAGLYHYPYIKILNEEKIIFGLSNLHGRFGLTSILQYQSAFFNNLIFGLNATVIPSAVIASTIITLICKEIFTSLKKKIIKIDTLFLFFLLIFISFKMNRYSEFGNDAPAHFLLFFLTFLFIKNYNVKEKFSDLCLISIFIVLNKITLVAGLFFPMIHFFKNKLRFSKLFNLKIFLCATFLLLWLLKNFFISACLVYPMKQTCFKKFSWSNPGKIHQYSVGIEAFAKGLPDQDDDKRLKGEIYYKNFNWLDTWTKNHFKEKIFYNMGIYIVILLSCFFILKIKFNKIYETKINYVRTSQFPYKIMLTISTLGIIIWFLKVPVFRFGYSFLTLFIISILLIILNKILIRKKIILNLFSLNFLVILCISAIVLKQAVRFEKKYDVKYYNYPWVKFYGSSVENNPVLNKTIKYNNIVLYRVPEADDQLCYFSKSICTPQNEVDKKIKYEIKNNYKFFSIIKSKN